MARISKTNFNVFVHLYIFTVTDSNWHSTSSLIINVRFIKCVQCKHKIGFNWCEINLLLDYLHPWPPNFLAIRFLKWASNYFAFWIMQHTQQKIISSVIVLCRFCINKHDSTALLLTANWAFAVWLYYFSHYIDSELNMRNGTEKFIRFFD